MFYTQSTKVDICKYKLKQRRTSMLKRHSILLKRINVEIWRFNIEKNVEIWQWNNVEIWPWNNVEIWHWNNVEVWRFNVEICRCFNVEIWRCFNVECLSVALLPCVRDTDYSFPLLRSNFACKLLIVRGRTLLILCTQGQICILCMKPVGTTQTTVFTLSLSNFTCELWMMKGGTLLILDQGAKVKVNFGTLYIKPCGHDTDCSFYPITFKLHMQVVDDERRNLFLLHHGVKGQGQLCYFVYKTLWSR